MRASHDQESDINTGTSVGMVLMVKRGGGRQGPQLADPSRVKVTIRLPQARMGAKCNRSRFKSEVCAGNTSQEHRLLLAVDLRASTAEGPICGVKLPFCSTMIVFDRDS